MTGRRSPSNIFYTMTKELWSFLVEGIVDAETGTFANFYAYGNHLGEAIANVLAAAAANGFKEPHIIEADMADSADLANDGDLVPVNENVYMQKETFSYPIEEGEHEFILPAGIIKAEEEGELDYDLIEEGFAAYDKDKNGLFSSDLVVSEARALSTLFKLIEFLPGVAGLTIVIKKHWEDQKNERWTSSAHTSKELVLDFLEKNTANVLQNGFLDCSVHATSGATITFDEHKKIHFATSDKKTFESYLDTLYKLKFEHIDDLQSIEYGYHHWHYRPANSLSRQEFITMLRTNGFNPSQETK